MRGRAGQTLPVVLLLVLGGCQATPGEMEDTGVRAPTTVQPARTVDVAATTDRPVPVPVFPDEDTTGVPHGVTLTPSEALEITEDGTVVDGLHVQGRIVVRARGVTIRNTLVESDTSVSPLHVTVEASDVLIEHVEVDNKDGAGTGIIMQGSGIVRRVDIHSADDGIRVGADDVTIEASYIHDLSRIPDGHHDCIQIRSGSDVTIRGNNLQAYVPATDDPMNAAIQIGSLSGEDQIADLLVLGNLMNGGNYTINGGGRGEVASARYAHNRFGRDHRFGIRGNMENSVWEDTNVWHDSGEPAP